MGAESSEMTVMVQRLSPERLSPYAIATGGGAAAALDLYRWNAEVSAALAKTIGHVEVILRNAIHGSLMEWSTREFTEPRWYLDPGHQFQARAIEDIRVARRRAGQNGRRPETTGGVVAELNFGFWRYLLASYYDATLWRQTLHQAFPGQAQRRAIQEATAVLHSSRNRLAHHEPMFNKPIADIRRTGLELAGWICPVSQRWIEQQCSVNRVLGRRPG